MLERRKANAKELDASAKWVAQGGWCWWARGWGWGARPPLLPLCLALPPLSHKCWKNGDCEQSNIAVAGILRLGILLSLVLFEASHPLDSWSMNWEFFNLSGWSQPNLDIVENRIFTNCWQTWFDSLCKRYHNFHFRPSLLSTPSSPSMLASTRYLG